MSSYFTLFAGTMFFATFFGNAYGYSPTVYPDHFRVVHSTVFGILLVCLSFCYLKKVSSKSIELILWVGMCFVILDEVLYQNRREAYKISLNFVDDYIAIQWAFLFAVCIFLSFKKRLSWITSISLPVFMLLTVLGASYYEVLFGTGTNYSPCYEECKICYFILGFCMYI